MNYRISYISILIVITTWLLQSCSEDNNLNSDPFVIAFESISKNHQEFDGQALVPIVYSRVAEEDGTFTISIDAQNAIYGVDFTTIPEAVGNTITLPVALGESTNSITFQKLNSDMDETSEIQFTITNISHNESNIQGNVSFTFNASAAGGGSILPEVGGPNEGNQVFVDLSTETTYTAVRDSWDLRFYGGDAFRVGINGSIFMATTALINTDIDAVTEADVSALQPQIAVGTFNPSNTTYIDAPNGSILETAIAEISNNAADNPVYLINLGYEVGTETPTTGSVAVSGDHRGWKKIRILRNGDNYVLQYANLDDTTHQEVTISKNNAFNFSFFSFNTNNIVSVEPERTKWDICFSVYTNTITGAGSYGFSDFVFHNRNGDVTSYSVSTADFEYQEFAYSNINTGSFLEDQTVIGSSWRDVFSGGVNPDLFYILKDSNNNIYKLRFLALTDVNGERGYPEFEYALLEQ